MTKIYRIVYKLTYQGSQEKEINIDFEDKLEAQEVLEKLRSGSVFKKVSYSFLREIIDEETTMEKISKAFKQYDDPEFSEKL